MKRRDLGQQFRWVELDHAVPIRIIGPLCTQYLELSRAVSAIWEEAPTRKVAVRWTSAFVWLLNTAARKAPLVAELIEAGVDECREAQDAFLVALDADVTWNSRGLDRRWIRVGADQHVDVSDALIALGKVTAILTPLIYGGQDPMLLDPDECRIVDEQNRTREEVQRDTYRRLRMKGDGLVVPHFEDPRISDRWLAAAAEQRVSEAIRWVARWGRGAGARSSSLLPLTILDYVSSNTFGQVLAPKKGSKGRRVLQLVMSHQDIAAFEVHLNERLNRHSDLSLDQARTLITSARGRARLAKIPLFSEDGRSAIKYERLARIFRQVAKKAGLTYVSHRGVRRTVSFHHLRHEYVFHRLEKIMMAPEHEHDARRRLLISYMGWSARSKMLDWYSQHFDSIFGVIFARQAAEAAPANSNRPVAQPRPSTLRNGLAGVL